ncbi:hypothetical protein ACLVZI_005111, partial [Escherichia coli]
LIYNTKISNSKFVTVVTALRIPPQTLARPFKMLIKLTYSVSFSLTLCDKNVSRHYLTLSDNQGGKKLMAAPLQYGHHCIAVTVGSGQQKRSAGN